MEWHKFFSAAERKELESNIWGRQVLRKSFEQEFFLGFPSKEKLVSALNGYFEGNDWTAPLSASINVSKIDDDGKVIQYLDIDKSEAYDFYCLGFTLCFSDLSSSFYELNLLKNSMSEYFGHPDLIVITAYLSPPRSIGVLHFDRQHNFFMQKEGIKKWNVSNKEAVKSPYDNLVYGSLTQDFHQKMAQKGYLIGLPRDCGKTEFVLGEGDMLYVPPGYYHVPETQTTPSLHYTLTIEPDSYWKAVNEELFQALLENCEYLNKDLRFLKNNDREELTSICSKILLNKISNLS